MGSATVSPVAYADLYLTLAEANGLTPTWNLPVHVVIPVVQTPVRAASA